MREILHSVSANFYSERKMGLFRALLVLAVVSLLVLDVRAKLKGDDCEVCIGFLNKFVKRMKERETSTSDQNKMEVELMKACEDAKGKDHRFCYYIGAADISATKLVKEVTKPLSFGKPTEKICEDLKKKDEQICELRYEKQIDLNNVDLKKLKVKELKKILNQWGEECRGCAEKSDFVNRINDLKPLHVEL